ncbi:hypothetical protein AALA58_06155, partial [Lactococcus ileimucosae]
IFTMAGEQYRYLENMGSGNHMIIRNDAIANVSWNNQNVRLDEWYDDLEPAVQAMVRPVTDNFVTGEVPHEELTWTGGALFIPGNLDDFPEVAADVTQVDTSGSPRAFALSLADMARLSGLGRAFPTRVQRTSGNALAWWIRTPSTSTAAWRVTGDSYGPNDWGQLRGGHNKWNATNSIRPALIINPSN